MNAMDERARVRIAELEEQLAVLINQNDDLRRVIWRMHQDREYLDPWLSSQPPSFPHVPANPSSTTMSHVAGLTDFQD